MKNIANDYYKYEESENYQKTSNNEDQKNQNYYIYPLTNIKLNTIFVYVNKMIV